MERRRITITAAVIVLICFFLPWIQVSCGATKETASGVDLARDGTYELWLIPFLMLAVLLIGSASVWKQNRSLAPLINLVCGLLSSYLMNRERLKFEDGTGLIRVGVTGWFWLGLASSIGLVILAVFDLLSHRRFPDSG